MSVYEPVAALREAPDATDSVEQRLLGRRLAAVLFTDIVGSAARAWELGDRAWCELLETHDEIVRLELDRFEGTEIDASDDGFFASFDSASAAIGCAVAVRARLRSIGLEIRSGVHVGEFQARGTRIGGVAVAVGARIASEAEGGEILVSRTVRDLASGSRIHFRSRGARALKGIPGNWELFAAEPLRA